MIIHITNEGIFVNKYELTTKFVGSSVMAALASYVLLPLAALRNIACGVCKDRGA